MDHFRALLKNFFYKTRLVTLLDYIVFQFSRLKHKRKNSLFRKANPDILIPPDYFLYETYILDYDQFYSDGKATAKEIVDWTKVYLKNDSLKILDWGCGLSRVLMHIPKFSKNSQVYGCDINKQMIDFAKENFGHIAYSLISYTPPTNYEDSFFDLVYALSVFTHIEEKVQEQWVKEIHRITNNEGIFLFTTHGKKFYSKLLSKEKAILEQRGAFTKQYKKRGHRMMTTYNSKGAFAKLIDPYFEIMEFYDGSEKSSKTESQDLWIVKKKTQS